MGFEKVSKEEWLKLSEKEKQYLTLEFNKSVEIRRRYTLIVTRGIALLCVAALFYIGYAQIQASKGYNQVMQEQGSLGYCYMCGLTTLRSCQCQYHEFYDSTNTYHPVNISEIAINTAKDNIKECEVKYGPKSQIKSLDWNLSF